MNRGHSPGFFEPLPDHEPRGSGIANIDFAEETLQNPGNVRPNRLFSANTDLILYRAGRLTDLSGTANDIFTIGEFPDHFYGEIT